jgi:soluble lytic murein transglycosylase
LLSNVQSIWTAGKSHPDECDDAFEWLIAENGVTPGLAWVRISLAMEARNPGMADYLVRFLPEDEKQWARRWRQHDREGYRRLDRALTWEDSPKGKDIVRYGLVRLARNDPDRAARIFGQLDGQFSWNPDDRGFVLRELAIWSAVGAADQTLARMNQVPAVYRDGRLLEWWARYGLATQDWTSVLQAISLMAGDLRTDGRWRYWEARALQHTGNSGEALKMLGKLAAEASYYGFLAADRLQSPYAICPEPPAVDAALKNEMQQHSGVARAVELRRAGIPNWARSEWQLAVGNLDREGLRLAAAVAVEEQWHEMAIFALGNSGDLKWYEWRFPLHHRQTVDELAADGGIDPAWVLGLMRSESAMAEDAVSSAGARGLMQLMPDVATQLARQHSIQHKGKQQLLEADHNILLGTLYLQDLMNQFQNNPVLATGAYNAGPRSVDRWLTKSQVIDPAVWIETLTYFETRDYIPRVLAFATIYDWRMNMPIRRITSRMPELATGSIIPDSNIPGTMISAETTEAVCLDSEG